MDKNIRIPIVMISDDKFIMPTCVAITSMIKNKRVDSFYDIFVIMAECNAESERKISELHGENAETHIIRASLTKYRDIKQLAHISIACLLKFDVCELIPQYDKILYLDGDIIVRGDLTELYNYDLQDTYAAAVKDLSCIERDAGNINAGVMLFNAKKVREEGLRDKLIETRKELGDRGSMDQQSFNIVTEKNYVYLPIRFNCVMAKLYGRDRDRSYSIEKLNDLYKTEYHSIKELIDDAIIIHFATGNKPWHYTFNAGAKEWYKYYCLSPYREVPFELKGIWKYRADKIKEAYRNRGLSGAARIITNKIRRIGRKRRKYEWE